MKQYIMTNIKEGRITNNPAIWNSISKAEINHYVWTKDYQPYASAQLVYTSDAFHLKMEAIEPLQNMRITNSGISREVFQDSCLEFFLMPSPVSDDRYINFEINPAGAFLVGIGSDREHRLNIGEQAIAQCRISTFTENIGNSFVKWGYILLIPFDFIQMYFNEFKLTPQKMLKCNFYKCGDLTPVPHYGTWNPIAADIPNFHLPEYFGSLILAQK